MYSTRKATQVEENEMRKSIPSPLGHIVTGFDASFNPLIESMSEVSAVAIPRVEYIRRRMPNGRFQFRTIVER